MDTSKASVFCGKGLSKHCLGPLRKAGVVSPFESKKPREAQCQALPGLCGFKPPTHQVNTSQCLRGFPDELFRALRDWSNFRAHSNSLKKGC